MTDPKKGENTTARGVPVRGVGPAIPPEFGDPRPEGDAEPRGSSGEDGLIRGLLPRPAPSRARPRERLTRPPQPMPDFVRSALIERGLMEAYGARPPYQRNDYLGWINRAKREQTRAQRLGQMLDELERGDVYMNMAWRPASRS